MFIAFRDGWSSHVTPIPSPIHPPSPRADVPNIDNMRLPQNDGSFYEFRYFVRGANVADQLFDRIVTRVAYKGKYHYDYHVVKVDRIDDAFIESFVADAGGEGERVVQE